MKLLLVLVLGCLTASASTFESNVTRQHGVNGWYIPQQNNSFEWLDKDVAESYLELMEKTDLFRLSISPVKFYLYTKSNPKKRQKIEATLKSINASKFNPHLPTRIVVHGFLQGVFSGMNNDLRDAWLSLNDSNVIIVDWARARALDYLTSVVAVPGVGKKLATLIDFLVDKYGMSLDNVYIIGHSLGAHIAGYAGKYIKSGRIYSIVALDAAYPLYSYDKPDKRLNSEDALYVESIQTNAGLFGFSKPIGKATFYPNGGRTQPHCLLRNPICSHTRSFAYYIEAIVRDNFASIKCNNYKNAIAKNCGATYSHVRMGADTNALMVEGEFYVPVQKKSPYGIMQAS